MPIDFSVVIPAHNEALYLESTLASVRSQDFEGNVELIVVDNNSDDATADIARDYADLILYCRELQGAAAARQQGARRARGNAILFVDADTVLSPNLLSEAARSLKAGYVGGCAPVEVLDDAFSARWTEACLNAWYRYIGPTFIPGLYCAREVFQRVGGWDVGISCAEEMRLLRRLREHGQLAWNSGCSMATDARRFRAEGYYALAFKGMLAQLFG
jgi:glycosyltransferase involved in cell wall biosynthesis